MTARCLYAIGLNVVLRDQKFSYPGVLIYAMAFYAFYCIIVALWRIAKEKTGSPLFKAAGAIDLSFAVTAMFTLQTAMYGAFSPERNVRLQNFIGWLTVAAVVTGIAVYMIVHGSRQIDRLRK